MPKITKVAQETKQANHPKQDRPRYRVSKQGEISQQLQSWSDRKVQEIPVIILPRAQHWIALALAMLKRCSYKRRERFCKWISTGDTEENRLQCNQMSCCSIGIKVRSKTPAFLFFSLPWNYYWRCWGGGGNKCDLFALPFKGLAACTWAATKLQQRWWLTPGFRVVTFTAQSLFIMLLPRVLTYSF